MKLFREILMHTAVVCCFTGAITKILDWYNPYMDFGGYLWFTQVILYAAVPLMMLTAGYDRRAGRKHGRNTEKSVYRWR